MIGQLVLYGDSHAGAELLLDTGGFSFEPESGNTLAWEVNGVVDPALTSDSYVLLLEDMVGKSIQVKATVDTVEHESNIVTVLDTNNDVAPTCVDEPTLRDDSDMREGHLVMAAPGLWLNAAAPSPLTMTAVWMVDGVPFTTPNTPASILGLLPVNSAGKTLTMTLTLQSPGGLPGSVTVDYGVVGEGIRAVVYGSGKVGQDLSFVVVGDDAGAEEGAQWYADGVLIGGATGDDYTLTAGDMGKEITVRVTMVPTTEAFPISPVLISAPWLVSAAVDTQPVLVEIPRLVLDGSPFTYGEIMANPGRWLYADPDRYQYDWYSEGVLVTTTTTDTLELIPASLLGQTLVCKVRAFSLDGSKSAEAESEPSPIIEEGVPPEGTVLSEGCVGNDWVKVIADGVGGSTSEIETVDAPSCISYDPPPEGMEVKIWGDSRSTGTVHSVYTKPIPADWTAVSVMWKTGTGILAAETTNSLDLSSYPGRDDESLVFESVFKTAEDLFIKFTSAPVALYATSSTIPVNVVAPELLADDPYVIYSTVIPDPGKWLNADPDTIAYHLISEGITISETMVGPSTSFTLDQDAFGKKVAVVAVAKSYDGTKNATAISLDIGPFAAALPPAGWLLGTFCSGVKWVKRSADGSGGYTDEILDAESSICIHPGDIAVLTGASILNGELAVVRPNPLSTDGPTPTYRWLANGIPITGETSRTFQLGMDSKWVGLTLYAEIDNGNPDDHKVFMTLGYVVPPVDEPTPLCTYSPTITTPTNPPKAYATAVGHEGYWINGYSGHVLTWYCGEDLAPIPNSGHNFVIPLEAIGKPLQLKSTLDAVVAESVPTEDVVEGFHPEGWTYGLFCDGNNQVERIADGEGGYTDVVVTADSPVCNDTAHSVYMVGSTTPNGMLTLHHTNTGAATAIPAPTFRWLVDGLPLEGKTERWLTMTAHPYLMGKTVQGEWNSNDPDNIKIWTAPGYLVPDTLTPNPTMTSRPSITTPNIPPASYAVLTAQHGGWINSSTDFHYSWYADGVLIPGQADLETYQLEGDQVGKMIHVVVKAAGVAGEVPIVSEDSETIGPVVDRFPPAGWVLGTFCQGTSFVKHIADGAGGYTVEVIEEDSPECPPDPSVRPGWMDDFEDLVDLYLRDTTTLPPYTMAFVTEMANYASLMGDTTTTPTTNMPLTQTEYWTLFVQAMNDPTLKVKDLNTRVMPFIVAVYRLNPDNAYAFIRLLRKIAEPNTHFSQVHREAFIGMQSLLTTASTLPDRAPVGGKVDLVGSISQWIFGAVPRARMINYFS